jgi:hypothetical protein
MCVAYKKKNPRKINITINQQFYTLCKSFACIVSHIQS